MDALHYFLISFLFQLTQCKMFVFYLNYLLQFLPHGPYHNCCIAHHLN